jgi:hypothetical protein
MDATADASVDVVPAVPVDEPPVIEVSEENLSNVDSSWLNMLTVGNLVDAKTKSGGWFQVSVICAAVFATSLT